MTIASTRNIQEALAGGTGDRIPTSLADFYRELLDLQVRIEEEVPEPGQPPADRLKEGQPLLRFEDLKLDWTIIPQRLAEAAALFGRYPGLFGEVPPELRREGVFTPELVRAWFEGAPLPEVSPSHQGLVNDIIHAVLQPVLRRYSRAWLGSVDQERWRRGYCPVCGGSPDLAYLSRENGDRRLVCSRCDAEWRFPRLECPHCRNTDQNTLSYLTDDTGLYRLYLCDKCHTYLKAVDLRQAKGEVVFPLERLAILGLDQQAREQGYHPGGRPVSSTTGG